jgi:hypothetical protein
VYEDYQMVRLTQPYVPGFLAFREADFLVELLEKLRKNDEKLFPQVVILDGNGILHQQGCGLACHVGVRANVSAIGVAKTFLQVVNIYGSSLCFFGISNASAVLFVSQDFNTKQHAKIILNFEICFSKG